MRRVSILFGGGHLEICRALLVAIKCGCIHNNIIIATIYFLKLKVHVQVYGLLRVMLISTEICVGNFNSSSKFCYSTY